MNRVAWIASWILPPMGMAGAYTVLALTSDTDNTGKSWMAIGFGFVLVLWFVFRMLVEGAGFSRALAVGDADKLLELSNKQLGRRRGEASRAPFLVYRGLAHELRGDWAAALEDVRAAKTTRPETILFGAAVHVTALVETGDLAGARRIVETKLDPAAERVDRRLKPTPHSHAVVARARLLVAEGKLDEGRAQLQRVIDDIRTGESLRRRAQALIAGA